MSVFGSNLKPRFAALGVIILLVIGALSLRLWSMQVISGASFAAQAQGNRIREVTIAAARGRILDAKGRPLAANRSTMAVLLAPSAARETTQNQQLLSRISGVIAVPVAAIRKSLTSSKQEALQPRVIRIDTPWAVVSYLSEHADEFPGLEVRVLPVRIYPYHSHAAHVLGYVGEISQDQLAQKVFANAALGDIVGKAGVERQFESVLAGEKGYQKLEVDSMGRVKRILERREPIPGRDVRLTIDIDVQITAEQALVDALNEAHRQKFVKARAGATVVLDTRTGAVVAMASVPTFDPNQFLGGIRPDVWAKLNDKASEYPLNNRAIMAAYPPASTFKVVTGLAGLQNGFTSATKGYTCNGKWEAMGKQWPKWCWNHAGHGSIDFFNGIVQSCDTVFYEIGYQFYKTPGERLQAFARSIGYGAATGIDLPSEVSGRVPDIAWKNKFNTLYPEYRKWLPGDTVNMAIGQGDLLVTPLQMASVFAAVGNGGSVIEPHVLSQVMSGDGSVALKAKVKVTRKIPVSPANLAVMQAGLLGVTQSGTGAGAFSGFPVKVAGKTGTAQVKGKDDYAWFAAYAPADAPRYAVSMVIEQGGHGGSVAAPAVREILAKLNGTSSTMVHTQDASR